MNTLLALSGNYAGLMGLILQIKTRKQLISMTKNIQKKNHFNPIFPLGFYPFSLFLFITSILYGYAQHCAQQTTITTFGLPFGVELMCRLNPFSIRSSFPEPNRSCSWEGHNGDEVPLFSPSPLRIRLRKGLRCGQNASHSLGCRAPPDPDSHVCGHRR